MIKTINKLVRDNVPELIHSDSRYCKTEIMKKDEYKQALLAKLVEEATEAMMANQDNLVIELSDLMEVIDAVIVAFDLSRAEVLAQQAARADSLGKFIKRIKLTHLQVRDK